MTTIITLVRTTDPHSRLKAGDTGVLVRRRRDPWGDVVDVAWDNGSRLSLIAGEDYWTEREPGPDDDIMYE